jgi:hypothetical protein
MKSLYGCDILYDQVNLPRDDPWVEVLDRIFPYESGKFNSNGLRDRTFSWDHSALWLKQNDLLTNGKQNGGQLMGNILSFPILCMVNFVAYWFARCCWLGERISFTDLIERYPVRINGDDILFKSEPGFYDIWMQCIKYFGFKPSPGKNLISDQLFQINSQLYMPSYQQHSTVVEYLGYRSTCVYDQLDYNLNNIRHIGYANFGLICNRRKNDCSVDYSTMWNKVKKIVNNHSSICDKSQDSDLIDCPDWVTRVKQAPSIYHELMIGCPVSRIEAVDRMYKLHQQPFVDQFPRLPWTLLTKSVLEIPYCKELISNAFRSIVPADTLGLVREVVSGSSYLNTLHCKVSDFDILTCYRRFSKKSFSIVGFDSADLFKTQLEWKGVHPFSPVHWIDRYNE